MYMLPLRFVKIGPSISICATRIVSIVSCKTRAGQRIRQAEYRAGTLQSACGGRPSKSLVILDNGTVFACPYTLNVLMNAIERANFKSLSADNTKETRRMRVYDVVDEEPQLNESELTSYMEASGCQDTSQMDEEDYLYDEGEEQDED